MRFLSDLRLYESYEYYSQYFSWPASTGRREKILYHCFWTGRTTELHTLALKSLLISQSAPFEIWVWMPAEDLAANDDFIRLFEGSTSVIFRKYDIEAEIQHTQYEPHFSLFAGTRANDPTRKSDSFRLIVLWKYGGIYFDFDVLFLKDLRPLCEVDFCYQWSNLRSGNNAVMHAFQGSRSVSRLMTKAVEQQTVRPRRLLTFEDGDNELSELLVFPSFVFDPIWISNDRRQKNNPHCNRVDDFFSKSEPFRLEEFFPAAYTYHWHNRWRSPISPGTVVGHLFREVTERCSLKMGK